MQNKGLIFLIISLFSCLPVSFAEEISVIDADTTWNLTLDNATDVGRLSGDPGVIVVKYADSFSYKSLDNPADIGRLDGECGVIVVKYADAISYKPLDNPADIVHLVGEPGVMVVKYADAISYKPMLGFDSSDWRDEWMGLDSEEGSTVTTTELQDAIHHWLEDIPVRGHIMSTTDLQEIIAAWLSG